MNTPPPTEPTPDPFDLSNDQGIYPKYVVFRHPGDDATFTAYAFYPDTATTIPLQEVDDFLFVLKPISDPHARVALAAYAQSVSATRPQLARDIWEVLSDF